MLSPDCLADLKDLFDHHKPNHANMTAISHGGHNILYGNLARLQNKWNLFKKKFCNLHNYICGVAESFWKDGSCISMLKAMYMVSCIVLHLPSVPQVTHMDFHDVFAMMSRINHTLHLHWLVPKVVC